MYRTYQLLNRPTESEQDIPRYIDDNYSFVEACLGDARMGVNCPLGRFWWSDEGAVMYVISYLPEPTLLTVQELPLALGY